MKLGKNWSVALFQIFGSLLAVDKIFNILIQGTNFNIAQWIYLIVFILLIIVGFIGSFLLVAGHRKGITLSFVYQFFQVPFFVTNIIVFHFYSLYQLMVHIGSDGLGIYGRGGTGFEMQIYYNPGHWVVGINIMPLIVISILLIIKQAQDKLYDKQNKIQPD